MRVARAAALVRKERTRAAKRLRVTVLTKAKMKTKRSRTTRSTRISTKMTSKKTSVRREARGSQSFQCSFGSPAASTGARTSPLQTCTTSGAFTVNINIVNITRCNIISGEHICRHEINENYKTGGSRMEKRNYKHTKQDFYRMELDKLDEVH